MNEEIKPRKWLLAILMLIAIIILVILINKIIIDRKSKEKEKKENWSIFNVFKNDTFDNFRNKIEKESFNSKYEHYTGTQSGFLMENLLDDVITNNKTNKNILINIKYNEISTNDPEKIKNIKQTINSGDKFEVSINYDEKGFVNEVVLELTEKDMSKIKGFNSSFDFMYSGTEYGSTVISLLDKIISNNQTNKEHILTVIYKDTTTSDIEEIRNLKKQIDKWTEYEIIYDYNEEGYIYQVKIEK